MQVKLATACIGCGEPVSVTLPETYATEQGCKEAGNVWLSPDANPHSAGEVENQYPAHCQPPRLWLFCANLVVADSHQLHYCPLGNAR